MDKFIDDLIAWVHSFVSVTCGEEAVERSCESTRFHFLCSEFLVYFLYLDHRLTNSNPHEAQIRHANLLVQYAEAWVELMVQGGSSRAEAEQIADLMSIDLYLAAINDYALPGKTIKDLCAVFGERFLRLINEPCAFTSADIGQSALHLFRDNACAGYPWLFLTRF